MEVGVMEEVEEAEPRMEALVEGIRAREARASPRSPKYRRDSCEAVEGRLQEEDAMGPPEGGG